MLSAGLLPNWENAASLSLLLTSLTRSRQLLRHVAGWGEPRPLVPTFGAKRSKHVFHLPRNPLRLSVIEKRNDMDADGV
jgi:hypothetical protein